MISLRSQSINPGKHLYSYDQVTLISEKRLKWYFYECFTFWKFCGLGRLTASWSSISRSPLEYGVDPCFTNRQINDWISTTSTSLWMPLTVSKPIGLSRLTNYSSASPRQTQDSLCDSDVCDRPISADISSTLAQTGEIWANIPYINPDPGLRMHWDCFSKIMLIDVAI